MYTELNGQKFDYVVLGTGLTETILAAYFTLQGSSVIQLEKQDIYGGQIKTLSINDAKKSIRVSSTLRKGN